MTCSRVARKTGNARFKCCGDLGFSKDSIEGAITVGFSFFEAAGSFFLICGATAASQIAHFTLVATM